MLVLVGVQQGTFRSACLPDGYNGTWKHGGHEHRLQSVLLYDFLLLMLMWLSTEYSIAHLLCLWCLQHGPLINSSKLGTDQCQQNTVCSCECLNECCVFSDQIPIWPREGHHIAPCQCSRLSNTLSSRSSLHIVLTAKSASTHIWKLVNSWWS